MQPETMPNALKEALDFEKKGREFYLRTAKNVSDPLSRRLFETLAEDESRHAQRILEIFAAQNGEGSWPALDGSHVSELESGVRQFFEQNRGRIKREDSSLEGYEFAMDMERTGIQMYRQLEQNSGTPEERRFYAALIAEERSHLEALQNVYFFLTQPGDWYQEDESKHWSWMNV